MDNKQKIEDLLKGIGETTIFPFTAERIQFFFEIANTPEEEVSIDDVVYAIMAFGQNEIYNIFAKVSHELLKKPMLMEVTNKDHIALVRQNFTEFCNTINEELDKNYKRKMLLPLYFEYIFSQYIKR